MCSSAKQRNYSSCSLSCALQWGIEIAVLTAGGKGVSWEVFKLSAIVFHSCSPNPGLLKGGSTAAPCLNSKRSLLHLLGLAAKGRYLQCSLLQMDAMHVKGGKTPWVPHRTEKCSSKTANRCAGNHSIKGWHHLGIGKIPGTVRHCSWCTGMWDCCGMGITPRGLASAADAAPAWNSICVSPMVLVLNGKWNFRRNAGCFSVQKSSGSTGSSSACWHVAFWAAVLFILESREVSPWKQ